MRLLILALALALAAVALALAARGLDGVVLIQVGLWRIELALVTLCGLILALMAATFVFSWFVLRVLDFPARVAAYQRRRDETSALRALREAMQALFEGRFARAERAAGTASKHQENVGVASLIAALAAHRMREFSRRDDWLRRIETDRKLTMARLVAGAQMWAESREGDRALEALDRLQASGARHLYATRIGLKAQAQAGRWEDVLKGLHALEKRDAIHAAVASRYRSLAYRRILGAKRHDPAALETAWKAISTAERRDPDLALEGARVLNLAGRSHAAAVAIELALAHRWDERLLDEYARAAVFPARERIEHAQTWLREHPQDAVLLRCLGQLCLREQLWGKASAYLEESLRRQPHPSTVLALARLAEATGDEAQAAVHYREAALGLASVLAAPVDGAGPAHDEPERGVISS